MFVCVCVCVCVCVTVCVCVLQVVLVDPGCYRELEEVVRTDTRGKGKVEMLDLKAITEGEEKLE